MRASSLLARLSVAVVVATSVLAGPVLHAPPAGAVGNVVYVVPGGAGTKDGSSWANAIDLLPATLHATPGQELWVKAGTYLPYLVAGRVEYFKLYAGVSIYGGFAGSETDLSQRDWVANPTILSGDIGTPGLDSDNANHVVESDDATDAVLDGFTITHGYANSGGFTGNYGAGIYIDEGNPQLSHLVIKRNDAHLGGGLMVLNGNPTLTDVTLTDNTASEDGGGIWAKVATLRRVNVTDNTAGGQGGGLWSPGYLDIDLSTITGNRAHGNGPLQAGEGGGAGIYAGGNLSLRNSTLSGNTADGYGGGISIVDPQFNHQVDITNVFVTGNSATGAGPWPGVGGGVAIVSGDPKLTNVVITGNSSVNQGGALYSGGKPTLVNLTIAGNSSASTGGIRSDGLSPIIRNSILWANGESYWQGGGFAPDVRNSIVQGGVPGVGNLDVDPKFVAAVPPAPSQGGDVLPDTGSPAINAGDNSFVPAGVTTDARGGPRINGGTVDMGALERQGDVTGPSVMATTPANGAAITTTFTATFSESVTGVSSSTFTLSNGAASVAGTVTKTATTATFTPSQPLVPGERYTARLLAGITDLFGNPIVPTTWTRRTSTVVDDKSPALLDTWDRDANAAASGGFYSAADRVGFKKVLQFTGTTVTVKGARMPNGGYATVYVDGVSAGTANFYASTPQWQATVFTKAGLAGGRHTVELRVRGTKPAASTGTWVYVDAFQAGATTDQENSVRVRDYFARTPTAGTYGGSLDIGWHATTGDTGVRPSYKATCRGTDLKIYGTKTPTSGKVTIYVDGVAKATVDLHSATVVHRQLLFDSSPLTDVRHAIRIDVLGTPTGTGSDVGFDYLTCP